MRDVLFMVCLSLALSMASGVWAEIQFSEDFEGGLAGADISTLGWSITDTGHGFPFKISGTTIDSGQSGAWEVIVPYRTRGEAYALDGGPRTLLAGEFFRFEYVVNVPDISGGGLDIQLYEQDPTSGGSKDPRLQLQNRNFAAVDGFIAVGYNNAAGEGVGLSPTDTLPASTTRYVRFDFDGSGVELFTSSDGVTYTSVGSDNSAGLDTISAVGLFTFTIGNSGTVYINFDTMKLEVIDTLTSEQAHDPDPIMNAVGVPVDTDLCWQVPDDGATGLEYDVSYWPASDPGTVSGPHRETVTCYTPGSALDYDTTYEWKVVVLEPNELNPPELVARSGARTWQFTTMPEYGQATLVSPADGLTGVTPLATVQWNAGINAEAHRVYFDPDEALVLARDSASVQGYIETTDTSYDPFGSAPMEFGVEYFWLVDEVAGGAVRAAATEAWSFTIDPLVCLSPVADLTRMAIV